MTLIHFSNPMINASAVGSRCPLQQLISDVRSTNMNLKAGKASRDTLNRFKSEFTESLPYFFKKPLYREPLAGPSPQLPKAP